MSQCVPSWDLDDSNPPTPAARLSYGSSHSNSSSCAAPDVPMLDYEVAELTWENGQLAMHGLGPPRVPTRHVPSTSPSKYTTWDKPRASGTLESIVNQATHTFPQRHHIINNNKSPNCEVVVDRGGAEGGRGTELVPWFDGHRRSANNTSITLTMDALVPCSNRTDDQTTQVMDSVPGGMGTCVVGCSTRVGSCSGSVATQDDDGVLVVKRSRVAPVPTVAAAPEWSSRDQSVSGSTTFGRDSQRPTVDACERELGAVGFTSSSFGSQENTSGGGRPLTKTTTTAATADENDSVCHSRPQREAADEEDKKKGSGKSSVSTKRSRAAAIHNQSERKRRDKINQRMKTLQKLVPNSSKTDKASMLDEVIDYLKQLQAQVHVMSRMSMQSAMMLPMTLQQQLQMSMMATPMNMGMGMAAGMGMGVMDMNTIARSNMTGISSVLHPAAAFMPGMTSWDGSGDRLQAAASATAAAMPDPLSAFLACQPQPMTMDAYSRMAAMYQQLQQQRSHLPSRKS